MPARTTRILIRGMLRVTVVIGIFAVGSFPVSVGNPTSQSTKQKGEVTVWAIPSSKVYHCPGSRWYGKTVEGKYMGECEAVRAGYRPAFGRGCGSQCK